MSEADAKSKLHGIMTALEKQADNELTGFVLHMLTPTIVLGLAYLSNSSVLCPRLTNIIVTAISDVSVFEVSLKEAKAMTSRSTGYDCSTPVSSAKPDQSGAK